jgi:hypothetical protein
MLGPVQVLVVGVPDPDRAPDVVAALARLPADGPVRCLDLFEVAVADDGALAITGPDAASPPSLPLFAALVDDDTAAPDAADGMWHLGQVVAPGSRAVVALLEHRWALGLRDTLVAAGAALQHETWLDEDDRATLELLLTSA